MMVLREHREVRTSLRDTLTYERSVTASIIVDGSARISLRSSMSAMSRPSESIT